MYALLSVCVCKLITNQKIQLKTAKSHCYSDLSDKVRQDKKMTKRY